MSAQYMPKTLAKTLTTIVCHAPWEYGLFWDSNGSMPWKELYWAMQEDPSLRFVRESHLRELLLLGIDLPFQLVGSKIQLNAGTPIPDYLPMEQPPVRLFHACKRKQFPIVLEHGLSASNRPFLLLAQDREMALRLGRRRDPEPVLVEVLARKASEQGIVIRGAGPGLFLVESLALEYLICPPLREEDSSKWAVKKKREKSPEPAMPVSPGSYFIAPQHFQDVAPGGTPTGKPKQKGRRGAQWKREARQERHKREV